VHLSPLDLSLFPIAVQGPNNIPPQTGLYLPAGEAVVVFLDGFLAAIKRSVYFVGNISSFAMGRKLEKIGGFEWASIAQRHQIVYPSKGDEAENVCGVFWEKDGVIE